MRYAMIMAGGTGTRLWPMSRTQRPKQLLPFIARPAANGASLPSAASPGSTPVGADAAKAASLLEIAAARLDQLVAPERRFICTGESYRTVIRDALPEFSDDRILGEPVGRDTVNAVGFAAAVLEKLDKDAIFIVLTADHLIEPEAVFRDRADLAFRLVEQDKSRLVTFSITPTYAATGYGYVERGAAIRTLPGSDNLAFKVERFVEKPDLSRAQAYFESGHFAWNSGMFVFHAATFMACLERFKPASFDGLKQIQAAWGTPRQNDVLNAVYPTLPKISVDYAVMEPASSLAASKPGSSPVQVCTVLTDVKWLDVGSWPSYAETLAADPAGNRVGGAIRTIMCDAKNNLVVGDETCGGHTIALLGVEDLVVVKTPDATLIMPRAKAEQLKKLHEMLGPDLK